MDGSIVLYLSVLVQEMTTPWSVQWNFESGGSSVGLDASPMAEIFLPKIETQ
jgi:hypothetical protein